MAKDYVVRFTGEDNLSLTISQIKNELKDFGGNANTVSAKIETINRALNNSNYRRALKEIMNLLVDLERLGQGSSATAVNLRNLGAAITDQLGDARQQMQLLSSDTASFDAAIEGFNLLASTASIATGAMALFGSENENVAEAIAKVQGAMGILQGVQLVSNMLNKDSIFMLLLKSKWQAIKEAATVKDTVATTANNVAEGISKVNSISSATAKGVDTVATVAHTAATSASTVALTAWNLTKAIGKSLLGDFSGLLIVGAGALATYAISTSGSSDETEKLNTSTKNVSNTFANTYALSLTNTMSKYLLLRNQYLLIKNEHLRVEWIRENKTEFQNLGLAVNSITDAENVFINNTSRVIQALKDRADAASWNAVGNKKLEEAHRLEGLIRDNNIELSKRKNKEVEDEIYKLTGVHVKVNDKYYSKGSWTKQVQKRINDLKESADRDFQSAAISDKKSKENLGEMGYKPNSVGSKSNRGTHSHSSSTTRHTPSSNRNYTATKEVVPEGSIKDLKNKISKLKAKIEVTTDPHTLYNLLKLIDEYLKLIKAMEVPIKLLENIDKNGISALGKLDTGLNLKDLKPNIPKIKAQALPEDWEKKWNQNNAILDKIQSLNELKDSLSELGGSFGDIASLWANLDILFKESADSSTLAGNGLATLGLSLLAIGGQGAVAKAGAVMAAVGLLILGYALASVQAAALGPIGWIGFAAAGLAQLTSIMSTIKGFSNGGIIQGINTHGDMSLARVNAGEMILNGSQLKKLFDLLDSSGGVGNNIGGNVTFTISGSNLKGVLKNYDSKMNKIK